jgi:hypothetical protein
MAAPVVYRLRFALLCIDPKSRTLVWLEPGSTVIHVSEGDQGMIVLRSACRELLAFAVDFENRAEVWQESDTELELRT